MEIIHLSETVVATWKTMASQTTRPQSSINILGFINMSFHGVIYSETVGHSLPVSVFISSDLLAYSNYF
jgi:hypothetical protein